MSPRTLFRIFVLGAAMASPAIAQVPGPGGPPDFADMRQRFMDRMKEMLSASDDEWKVLQPKIEKVQQLQREASGMRGMFMMFGPGPGGPPGGGPGAGPGGPPPVGPGGPPPGGPDGDRPQSPVQQKVQELRSALDNKDAKPEEIKSKLQALRDARAKAKADLSKAQDELRDLLTARQESVLVMLGMLE